MAKINTQHEVSSCLGTMKTRRVVDHGRDLKYEYVCFPVGEFHRISDESRSGWCKYYSEPFLRHELIISTRQSAREREREKTWKIGRRDEMI